MTRSAACRMTGSIWRTDTTTNCRTARTVHNNQVSPRPRRWRRAPPCCFFLSLSVHFPYYIYSCITVPGNIAAICREGKTAPSTRRSTVAWKWDNTSTETEFNRNYLTVNRTLCSVIKAISYLPHYKSPTALSHMHHLTCGISSLLHPVNLILFTPPGSPHPACITSS